MYITQLGIRPPPLQVGKTGTQELDAAILHALLQGDVAKNEDPLELAVTWNRDDVAASDILSNEMDISQRENMDKLMLRCATKLHCNTKKKQLYFLKFALFYVLILHNNQASITVWPDFSK